MNKSGTYFGSFGDQFSTTARVVELPEGIATEDELFRAYYEQLDFPGWFGFNWNALWDCLSDLAWLKCDQVVVLHKDVPAVESRVIKIYAEVLVDCTIEWREEVDREFIVVFPDDAKPLVEPLVTSRINYFQRSRKK